MCSSESDGNSGPGSASNGESSRSTETRQPAFTSQPALKRIGQYQIKRAIASGGMGTVYEAVLAQQRAEEAREAEARQRQLAEDRFAALPTSIRKITAEDARNLLEKGDGFLYLDVRSELEFADGHVPNALNIPYARRNPATNQLELNEQFLTVVKGVIPREARVIVGCRSGLRSARATEKMVGEGYRNAYNVIENWSKLGYPVERGDGGAGAYALLLAKATDGTRP